MEKISRIKLTPEDIDDAIGDWLLKVHKVVVMGPVDFFNSIRSPGELPIQNRLSAEVDTEDKPTVKRGPRKAKAEAT